MKLGFKLTALAAMILIPTLVWGHCQVPCGIYADQRRFEEMLEDTETIAKSMKLINELASKKDAQSKSQLVRWVVTKENHATNTQRIIADYFMSQRIKPASAKKDVEKNMKKLMAAHEVMVAAMKCKQSVDVKYAKQLHESILNFYRAYEGKEPKFGHDHP